MYTVVYGPSGSMKVGYSLQVFRMRNTRCAVLEGFLCAREQAIGNFSFFFFKAFSCVLGNRDGASVVSLGKVFCVRYVGSGV